MGHSIDPTKPRSKHWARGTVFASSGARQGNKLTRTKKSEADVVVVSKAVQQSTLLGAILAPQLQEMIEYMVELALRPGQTVDLSGGMGVILEGKVEMKSGPAARVCHFRKGAVVGDVGLLHSRTGDDLAHARAVDATRICVLRRSVYMEVMEYSRCARSGGTALHSGSFVQPAAEPMPLCQS
jgi:hypothetical protein